MDTFILILDQHFPDKVAQCESTSRSDKKGASVRIFLEIGQHGKRGLQKETWAKCESTNPWAMALAEKAVSP